MDISMARKNLHEIFRTVLDSCSVGSALDRISSNHIAGVLRDVRGKILVIAMGKSAVPMTEEALGRFDISPAGGVVVSPALGSWSHPRLPSFEGGHPMPNEASLEAAKSALTVLGKTTENDLALFLISGGASACFELPLTDEISLKDLIEMNRLLITGELTIVETNIVRKHLSRVKGGRLAVAAAPARQLTLYVSDVPRGCDSFVASGPSMPDDSTAEDAYEVIERHNLTSSLPKSIGSLFSARSVPETPKKGNPAFRAASWIKLLDNDDAIQAAKRCAENDGWKVVVVDVPDSLSAREAAGNLVERAERELASQLGKPVAVISGGELTSPVLGRGKGGRNQAFVLECVELIAGKQMAVLSGGTDGIDGNSSAAGAIADGATLGRSLEADLSVEASRNRSDSNGFFRAIGDEIVTGPTGVNVRDIRVVLAW